MLLVLKSDITPVEISQLQQKLVWMGLHAVPTQDDNGYSLAIISGSNDTVDIKQFIHLPGVKTVVPFEQKYKLASIATKKQRTVIHIGQQTIGAEGQFVVMAGPCSVESEQQIEQAAAQAAASGATILRGGLFKPRTSPYEFQGLGAEGLRFMETAAKRNNLLTITEVMSVEQIDVVAAHIDIIQIGAEYIMSVGNNQVMLCERGIRTFENFTRNTLDIAAVPVLQSLTHLPVIIDPSHGVGIRQFVAPLAKAAMAIGAEGIIVEIHPDPACALSDGPQSLTFPQFDNMMKELRRIGAAVDKKIF